MIINNNDKIKEKFKSKRPMTIKTKLKINKQKKYRTEKKSKRRSVF